MLKFLLYYIVAKYQNRTRYVWCFLNSIVFKVFSKISAKCINYSISIIIINVVSKKNNIILLRSINGVQIEYHYSYSELSNVSSVHIIPEAEAVWFVGNPVLCLQLSDISFLPWWRCFGVHVMSYIIIKNILKNTTFQ